MAGKPIVLVTGSAGFIGSAVVERLRADYHVIGLDLHKPETLPPDTDFVKMDLSSEHSIRGALTYIRREFGAHIASVVHLAAYFDLSGEDNPLYEDVTVEGSQRLLEALDDFTVEQFIFSSTMLIHKGTKPGETFDEERELEPSHPYRASKVRTERALLEKHEDIPLVLLRPAGVYDDMCHNAFLAQQIARVYEQQLIAHLYPGDLTTGQSFLHLDDLTDAILRIIDRRKALPPQLPLLLGEDDVMSVKELQARIGTLAHGEAFETWRIPAALAKTGAWMQNDVMGEDVFIKAWMVDIADDHYAPDTSRAKDFLGWKAKHRLRDALPTIIANLKDDPEHWYRVNRLNHRKVQAIGAEAAGKHSEREMQAHEQQMRRMHLRTLWTQFSLIMLGLWLMTSPFVWGSFSQEEFSTAIWSVTEERNLWEPAFRNHILGWSDIISGAMVTVFAILALRQRYSWARWANTIVGCWLLFAPILFWSPDPANFNNDMLVGALVIAFSILVPMMPGMSHEGMMDETDIPPGWTYSPSAYSQRIPIIGFGLIGFLVARYLTAYQLGHSDVMWDPFFGEGTARIITSDVSKAWPIPDAGLGAISYMFEILMGIMGSSRRWRTMPWMVLGFGIVVVPLGAVSIFFIIIQPIVIGTWCSLCLLAAAAMVIMIPFTLDEVVASCQFLAQVYRRKKPFWHNFFRGGSMPGGSVEPPPTRARDYIDFRDLTNGITWQLAACTAIGALLMLTRLLFGTEPPLADSDHLIGSLIIVFSISAYAEVARPLRLFNLPMGAWLILSPFMMEGGMDISAAFDVAAGVALLAFSLPRGTRSHEHYGSWDRFVF